MTKKKLSKDVVVEWLEDVLIIEEGENVVSLSKQERRALKRFLDGQYRD